MNSQFAGSNRVQQTLPPALFLGLSVWVAYISFAVDDPEPYLFPRLVSVGLVVLALLALVQAISGKSQTGQGLTFGIAKAIFPALIVMAAFVFYAIEFLGMYTASAATFLVIFTLYDPAPHTEIRSWIKRIVITAGFMAVMYGLFALLLKVQTPRGLFF